MKLEDITEEFISYMRASGHELTYSIPAGPAGYRGESVPGIFRGDEPRLPGERKRPGDDGGNGVKNKDGWATGMTGRKAGKMKIIAKVPKDTTPYRCGERLMACITKGETLEIEKCVEFFKTTEEARSFTAENPEYKFKSQNG